MSDTWHTYIRTYIRFIEHEGGRVILGDELDVTTSSSGVGHERQLQSGVCPESGHLADSRVQEIDAHRRTKRDEMKIFYKNNFLNK